MMRFNTGRCINKSVKSFFLHDVLNRCIGSEQRALFSTSICSQRNSSSGSQKRIRSIPKLDDVFPAVVDFPNRHIGPRKHESKAMLNELGYNVSMVQNYNRIKYRAILLE